MSRRRIPRNTRNGAVVVEAAMVLPVLALLIFATAETSQRIFEIQSLTVAASEAARVALIPDASLLDVEQQANEIAKQRQLRSVTVTVEPADFDRVAAGTFIRVTVSADVDDYAFAGLLMQGDLSATVSMMKER